MKTIKNNKFEEEKEMILKFYKDNGMEMFQNTDENFINLYNEQDETNNDALIIKTERKPNYAKETLLSVRAK